MRAHKYLTDPIETADEAGYRVEEGIVLDPCSTPADDRRAYDEFTRYWRRTKDELRAEEESWAARSGPCVILKPARHTTTRKAG
jgi:hypothetical protein